MKQPIAGVVPPELAETRIFTLWPTIGAITAGRLVGRLASNGAGYGIFTVGNLLAVVTIPLSLAVFAWQLMPYLCRRYTVTNQRVILRCGLGAREDRWVKLDDFDTIELEILPGQQWLHAGDVVFKHGGMEVFRFAGVSRPEIVRQICLKARDAVLLVRRTLLEQAA
jgi:hypothetical protein